MEKKRIRRERHMGRWFIGIACLLLLMAYIPFAEKAYKHLTGEGSAQVVHGIITQAQAAQVTKPQKEVCTYTVQEGDTLTSIARRADTTIDAIAKRNHIKNIDIILIGQVLILGERKVSSDMAMSKASSEKFIGHAGASQKKPLTKSLTKRKHGTSHAQRKPAHHIASTHNGNCAIVGARIRNVEDRLIARAGCIREHYGNFIKDAVASQGNKFSELEIIAVMLQESKGDPHAVSKADVPCLGLMQLQPPTAQQYGVRRIFDPRENIFGGVRVLTDYVYRYGNGNKAYGLAAYNMGPGGFHKTGLKPEEVSYVREVNVILQTLESHQFTL